MTNDDKNPPRGFRRAFKMAEELANDSKKTSRVLKDAEQKATSQGQKIKAMGTDLHSLFRLVESWVKGNYKKVPLQTILFAMAAIIYFVNPFDAVPDYIPFAGYLDDMTIIGFVVKSIRKDIQEFLVWEKHS